jgi:riboflavin biosynthesis pyrimidine reductase
MRQPLCVVLDTDLTHLRKLLQDDEVKGSGESSIRAKNLVICCSHSAARKFQTLPKMQSHQHDMSKKIRLLGCKTNIDDGTLNLVDVLVSLKSKFGIKSVLVEGGANVLSSFLDVSCQQMAKQPATQLVDSFVITISPKILGAINGLGSFSKFNSLNKQTFPSLDFLSPTSFFRKVGSDLVIASPMRGL